MKTTKHLFPQLLESDTLDQAATEVVRGKRYRKDIAHFLFQREERLRRVHEALIRGTYEPAGYDLIRIRDPKPRVIARAPVEDRIVQTAVVRLMLPTILRSCIPENMACRQGYGTHRALIALLGLTRRFSFCVHLDIRSYFPSVDLSILLTMLQRTFKDEPFLQIVDRILQKGAGLTDTPAVRKWAAMGDWPPPGRGLPIGAHTSQVFATHVYLNGLDHFIKRELKVQGYVRYVDDLFLFGNQRSELRCARERIAEYLRDRLSLRLKHPKARVLSCWGHVDGLGYRIRRSGLDVLPRAVRRLSRAVVRALHSRASMKQLERAVPSVAGLILFG